MTIAQERWDRVEQAFQRLMDEPTDGRERLLDEVCQDDDELRILLASLLEADGDPHDALVAVGHPAEAKDVPSSKPASPHRPADKASLPASIGRYRILKELGRGGMGIVYLAEDPDLKRPLAIKVLPPEWQNLPRYERRLEREARMLAALSHPNVATLHSLERDGETRFLTMELANGVTLGSLIGDERLSMDRAFRVCDQIAAALEVAHAHRIIHRDLKPANVMVDADDRVKVLDFGLAKMLADPADPGVESLSLTTGIGLWRGTPGYMSPEQVRGQAADRRSDIWMFGCTLFECFTLWPAFPGVTGPDRVVATLHDTPDWSVVSSVLSASTMQILEACLKRDPDQRPESIAEVKRALQAEHQALGPITDLTTRARPGVGPRSTSPIGDRITSAAPTDTPSLAILPFVDMSRGHVQEPLCDGLAEELIDVMAKVAGLRVVARTSSFAFKGKAVDIREIGVRLNVHAILEGSVRTDGKRLRIDAHLIDVRTGNPVWSDRYDGELADVLTVQGEIASAIAKALQVELLKPHLLTQRRHISTEAYTLYLRGQFFVNRATRADYERAVQYFKETIDLVPYYAPAHVGLATTYIMMAAHFYRVDLFRQAKEIAEKAVELDPNLAAGFTALGYGTWLGEWDWEGGFQHLQRAIEVNPMYSTGHSYMGTFHMSAARYSDALVSYQNALDIDPLYVFASQHLGCLYIRANQTKKAQDQLQRSLEMSPQNPTARWCLGQAYVLEGRFDDGIAEMEAAIELGERLPTIVSALGCAHAQAGRMDVAQGILDELRSRSRDEYVGAYCLAKVAAAMGEPEAALTHLEEARQAGDYLWLVSVLTDESFRSLRRHPGYLDLVDRLGLRERWDQREWPEGGLVE